MESKAMFMVSGVGTSMGCTEIPLLVAIVLRAATISALDGFLGFNSAAILLALGRISLVSSKCL
jgi:hypothetical protein